MSTIHSIGLSGLATAQSRLVSSAERIAGAPQQQPGSLAAELVAQREALAAFKANLHTVQAADEMLGALLDTFA